MAEDLELDLTEEPNITNPTEERIKKLSSKVRDTAAERDEAKAAAQAAEQARIALEKERDFLNSFSDHVVKYPAAAEHKDAIKEKVLAGYSPEDAVVAVLAANNQFAPAQAPVEMAPIAGGSATIQLTGDSRPNNQMTQEERRAKLLEADGRGELVDALRSIR